MAFSPSSNLKDLESAQSTSPLLKARWPVVVATPRIRRKLLWAAGAIAVLLGFLAIEQMPGLETALVSSRSAHSQAPLLEEGNKDDVDLLSQALDSTAVHDTRSTQIATPTKVLLHRTTSTVSLSTTHPTTASSLAETSSPVTSHPPSQPWNDHELEDDQLDDAEDDEHSLSPSGELSTLVYTRADLQRIWQWEIASGHYVSKNDVPDMLGFTSPLPLNAAQPPAPMGPPHFVTTGVKGVGLDRVYLNMDRQKPNLGFPPRPMPGSIMDMDLVTERCDYSTGKYVRDCLEGLRIGGGLDDTRLRRGSGQQWNYMFAERLAPDWIHPKRSKLLAKWKADLKGPQKISNGGLVKKAGVQWEPMHALPPLQEYRPSATLNGPCDPDYPRIFHMFWSGTLTDKPYIAMQSFLYTQNLALNQPVNATNNLFCRPSFWLWINPGPAAGKPGPTAERDMLEDLRSNPWASWALHPRFRGVIEFKLWSTEVEMDKVVRTVPELKDWRDLPLFNSGGHVIHVPSGKRKETNASVDMLHRTGSTSSKTIDKLSVVLSDLARWVLCHSYGGIYLDADNILLRDWEEIWGVRGAWSYRWSKHEKYNTAVLKLNRGSALGAFLFRTALKNGLDWHPFTVSRYTKDAYLEGLLRRLPDALFDSAWLNMEGKQRERPPQPFFQKFAEFFNTKVIASAAPSAMGFSGFYRGAYSYHFHNGWWEKVDRARDWPDLGQRFIGGEISRRKELFPSEDPLSVREDDMDLRDLDWSAVLKRTFESFVRGEAPNMYGEYIVW